MSSLFMTWHHCYAACCCSSTQTPLLPHHATLPRTPGQQTHSHHTPLTQCQNHFPSKYGNSRELSAVLTSSCGTESLKPHWGYYLLNKKKKSYFCRSFKNNFWGSIVTFAFIYHDWKFLLSQVNSKGFHEASCSLQRVTIIHALGIHDPCQGRVWMFG